MEHFKLVFGSGNSDPAKIRPLKNWPPPFPGSHRLLGTSIHRDVHPFCWRSVVLSQESRHGGGGFRLSSLRKSAIVAGLRGRYRLLRAVGEVSALRATDL